MIPSLSPIPSGDGTESNIGGSQRFTEPNRIRIPAKSDEQKRQLWAAAIVVISAFRIDLTRVGWMKWWHKLTNINIYTWMRHLYRELSLKFASESVYFTCTPYAEKGINNCWWDYSIIFVWMVTPPVSLIIPLTQYNFDRWTDHRSVLSYQIQETQLDSRSWEKPSKIGASSDPQK